MSLITAIAIYFLIWWLVLFTVLPFGIESQGESGAKGTDPGAPLVPRLKLKLLWTTVISAVLFAIYAFFHITGLITLDGLAGLLGL